MFRYVHILLINSNYLIHISFTQVNIHPFKVNFGTYFRRKTMI